MLVCGRNRNDRTSLFYVWWIDFNIYYLGIFLFSGKGKKMTGKKQLKIIDEEVLKEIPLIAVKSYPTRIFENVKEVKLAYASVLNGENNFLGVVFNPKGITKKPDPEICFFIRGDYHKETLQYYTKDPMKWVSWIEFVLDLKNLDQLIKTLTKIRDELK